MKAYRFIFGLVCGLSLLVGMGGVEAQEKYPSRPIELVVVMTPGGVADLSARTYNEELAGALKVPVTVVNRAGGGGIAGTAYAARAKKDGYTVLQTNESPMVTLPVISKDVTYDPLKDLLPLARYVTFPNLFAVRSDSPFKELKDLVEYGQKNPGKLRGSSGALWNASHLNFELFCAANKIKPVAIPYGSAGEAVAALLGGHLDLLSVTPPSIAPHIKAGKARGLCFTSRTQDPNLPDIPTTAQLGYSHESYDGWLGVFVPAGVPQEVVNVLAPALEKTFKNPEVVQRAAKIGCVVDYMGPEEFRKYIESRFPVMRKIAEDNNLIKK